MNTASLRVLLVALLAVLAACREDGDELINPNDRYPLTPSEQFEAFWSGMAQSYVFWDRDTVDWLARREEFGPLFRELDKMEAVSTSDLAKLYTDLCDGLLDHHLRLEATNRWAAPGKKTAIDFYPGIYEIRRRPGFHELIPDSLFQSVYKALESCGRLTHLRTAKALTSQGDLDIASGVIDGSTAYLHFSQFALTSLLLENPDFIDQDKGYDNPAAVAALKSWQVWAHHPDISRVVIDVRSNLGGYVSDMLYVLSPLTDRTVHLADIRAKNGIAPLDYGPWLPLEIAAGADAAAPMTVMLTDTWSCSMAELTAMAAHLLPGGGVVVGERTFGATGPRTSVYPVTFNGQFATLDGSLRVTMATWETRFMPDGVRLEGTGVTPDVSVRADLKAMESGRDPQLEKALSL